jgi:hypothetical protein
VRWIEPWWRVHPTSSNCLSDAAATTCPCSPTDHPMSRREVLESRAIVINKRIAGVASVSARSSLDTSPANTVGAAPPAPPETFRLLPGRFADESKPDLARPSFFAAPSPRDP